MRSVAKPRAPVCASTIASDIWRAAMRADLSSVTAADSVTCLPAPVAVTVPPGVPVTRICPFGPTWK